RSRTTWSMERWLRNQLTESPACPAPITTTGIRDTGVAIGSVDGHRHLGRVGQGVEDSRTTLRLGDQGLDVLLAGVGVDLEVDPDTGEPVTDFGVGTEDPEDVVVTF